MKTCINSNIRLIIIIVEGLMLIFPSFQAYSLIQLQKFTRKVLQRTFSTQESIIESNPFPLSTLSNDFNSSSLKQYNFVIYGEPVALARHRTTKFGMVYNPSAKQQKQFQLSSLPFLPLQPLDGPLEAQICFYFSRPKYHYRTGKYAGILKENVESWYTKKPDLDNLIKFVLDSLNSKAYVDDSQVVSLLTRKMYTNHQPRVEVTLRTQAEICTYEDILPVEPIGLETIESQSLPLESSGELVNLEKKVKRRKKKVIQIIEESANKNT